MGTKILHDVIDNSKLKKTIVNYNLAEIGVNHNGCVKTAKRLVQPKMGGLIMLS